MARTKLMRKQEYYQRKKEYQAAAQRSIGNKNIFNCIIRNRRIKIKKVLPQFRDLEVKHSDKVVRRMEWLENNLPK